MVSTRFCLLSLLLVSCLAAVSCQRAYETDDLEDTTKDPQRWKTSGADIVLLVRKVDEDHPYFKSLMFRVPTNRSEILPRLTKQIGLHCNISNVTMLVKNDLLVLRQPDDAANLVSGDRIEAWQAVRGLATRAKTSLTFAKYARTTTTASTAGKPMGGGGGGGGGSGGGGSSGGGSSSSGGAHHGGGRGRGRRDRQPAAQSPDSVEDIFSSIELEGF